VAASQSAGDINSEIYFEEGINPDVVSKLKEMGHQCEMVTGYRRGMLGKGQVIQRVIDPNGRGVWACGSDLRGDGSALGQI
jgi:gamma-glutamyltranspeptidase/glutathione hydrolase